MTNSEISAIAAEVYGKYVSHGGSYKKFQEIMRSEGIKFRVIKPKDDDFVGVLIRAPNGQLYITINDGIENQGRRNFTIAHELGHYFLNHLAQKTCFYCGANEVQEEKRSSTNIEREANYFADCLLMPEDRIKSAFRSILKKASKDEISDFLNVTYETYKHWCVIRSKLTKRYGVSETALRYRLQELGLAQFDFGQKPSHNSSFAREQHSWELHSPKLFCHDGNRDGRRHERRV